MRQAEMVRVRGFTARLDGLAAGPQPRERHFIVDTLCELLEFGDLHARHVVHAGLDLRVPSMVLSV